MLEKTLMTLELPRLLLAWTSLAFLAAAPAAVAAEPEATFERGVNISHWMAQHSRGHYADSERFAEEDARWIAERGFDHVRIPVDGRILMSVEGKLIHELLEPFDEALDWCQENGLGVILDMHYLPGNEFLNDPRDNALWSDPALQQTAAALWRAIAEKYQATGQWLRYELLNEAVAPENEQLNELNRLLVATVREVDQERILYVSSNLWGQFSTVPDVYHFADDPNVHYAFHIYEPLAVTHQAASWSDFRDLEPGSVRFPGTFEAPARITNPAVRAAHGARYDEAFIQNLFKPVADWARERDAAVVITEFGVYQAADRNTLVNWIRTVAEECEKAGFGWTIWDYKGGFAIRDSDGSPTAVYEALFSDG